MTANYSFEITTPANTPESAALFTDLMLSTGIIDKIAIQFAPGCAALNKVQILDKLHVLFPSNPNSYYAWDNDIIEFNTYYEIKSSNYLLQAKTWNIDTINQHTITIMININDENTMLQNLNAFINQMVNVK